jgi:4-hydroxy-tetrahydrodipicolinate synthase
VAVFGTTGEANSLSVEERIELLDAVLAAGVAADRLMVGTGCCALPDTVKLTAHAVAAGCKNVLMLPPFYYKGVSDEGLFAGFAEVIERVGDSALGIYLYHFPRLSGVPITRGLIDKLLAAYPETLKGVKDSSGDAEATAALIEGYPRLAIFPGNEVFMLAMLEKGAAGCISASGNVNALAIRRVYDAWRAGEAEAGQLQARITAQRKVLEANPLVPTLKQILSRERADPAWLRLRPPLVSLDATAVSALFAGIEDAGLAFGRD